jgi:hypothetical protein
MLCWGRVVAVLGRACLLGALADGAVGGCHGAVFCQRRLAFVPTRALHASDGRRCAGALLAWDGRGAQGLLGWAQSWGRLGALVRPQRLGGLRRYWARCVRVGSSCRVLRVVASAPAFESGALGPARIGGLRLRHQRIGHSAPSGSSAFPRSWPSRGSVVLGRCRHPARGSLPYWGRWVRA